MKLLKIQDMKSARGLISVSQISCIIYLFTKIISAVGSHHSFAISEGDRLNFLCMYLYSERFTLRVIEILEQEMHMNFHDKRYIVAYCEY